jgi:hypothetical protein
MQPIEFNEQTTVIAKDQPQYRPLPIHIGTKEDGKPFTSCWKLTWKERFKVLLFGKIWFQQLTFGQLLQPQLPLIEKPELKSKRDVFVRDLITDIKYGHFPLFAMTGIRFTKSEGTDIKDAINQSIAKNTKVFNIDPWKWYENNIEPRIAI